MFFEWHKIDINDLAKELNTDLNKGLTEQKAAEILANDRPLKANNKNENVINAVSVIETIFGGFSWLLWIASGLCFAIFEHASATKLILGVALIVINIGNAFVLLYQKSRISRIINPRKRDEVQKVVVIRDGVKREIDSEELVSGDIFEIKAGIKVPADARLIIADYLKVDHSVLTGEQLSLKREVDKSEDNILESMNLVFAGTSVIEGTGTAIAIRTGENTLLKTYSRHSIPLIKQAKAPIEVQLSYFYYIFIAFSFVLSVIYLSISLLYRYSWINTVILLAAIISVLIPVALKTAYTTTIASTIERLIKKKCWVKNIASFEKLSEVSVFCIDKTGVITQNSLTVGHMWFDNVLHPINDSKNEIVQTAGWHALSRATVLCHREPFATLKHIESKLGDLKKFVDSNPKLAEIPFTAKEKYMISIHQVNDSNGTKKTLLFIKGAPERVFSKCATIKINGKNLPIDDHWQERFNSAYLSLGSKGERILGIAELELDSNKYNKDYKFDVNEINFPLEELNFLGLISLVDPPRAGVKNAILKLRKHGMRVIMITGDHQIVAENIAKRVGILSENELDDPNSADTIRSSDNVINGNSLAYASDEDLSNLVSKNSELVFTRTSPNQKKAIVQSLQKQGAKVAVIGDGVNDLEAVRQADVGISMGRIGCYPTNEAADLILLEDNFESIVDAFEESRTLSKFVF